MKAKSTTPRQSPRCGKRTRLRDCCGIDLTVRRRPWRMTAENIRLVHVLKARKGLDDETYRLRLAVEGVASCKDLGRGAFRRFIQALAQLPDAPRRRGVAAGTGPTLRMGAPSDMPVVAAPSPHYLERNQTMKIEQTTARTMLEQIEAIPSPRMRWGKELDLPGTTIEQRCAHALYVYEAGLADGKPHKDHTGDGHDDVLFSRLTARGHDRLAELRGA